MIENDIKQLEADIEQERLNAEEASNLIEENKAIEKLKLLNTGQINSLKENLLRVRHDS